MPTCFVMQPFDGGKFDKRYDEVFKPAIIAAGLEAYRVDKDPAVSIPIADIERGIQDANLCLAEITEDNPNVWFELGYAFARNKEVVLVCSKERTTKFPFDVQHRSIIQYDTRSPSDFVTLKDSITNKIKANLKKLESLATIPELVKSTAPGGLSEHEVAAMVTIAATLQHPGDDCSAYILKRDMENSGYTNAATILAMKRLERLELIVREKKIDHDAQSSYEGYSLTEKGWDWNLENQNRFNLRVDVPTTQKPRRI